MSKCLIIKESLWGSIVSDVFTFGMLIFCIWFSGDSKFWGFICFLMFFMFMMRNSPRVKRFTSMKDAKEWIDKEVEKENT